MALVFRDASGNQIVIGAGLSSARYIAAPGGGGGGSLRPTTTATSITVGGVTFSWTGSLECGYYVDGQAFVVAPSGLTVQEPTPALSSISSRVINGCAKNLAQEVGNPFDSASSTYSAGLQASFPDSGAAGDCYLKARSEADYGGVIRDGVIAEYAALHVVSTVPGINAFSPPAVWPAADKATRPTRECDLDTAVAGLPSYSGASVDEVPYSDIIALIPKFNPVIGFTDNAATTGGYEVMMPHSYNSTSGVGNNYGNETAQLMNAACLALILDSYTSAQKKEILKALISFGLQTWEPWYKSGNTITPDGGHWNFICVPAVIALYFTGQSARIANVFDHLPGNTFGQCFYLTAQDVTDITSSHTAADKPFFSRERTIASVSGTSITVNTFTGGSGGSQYDMPKGFMVAGMRLTRKSDGATAMITAGDGADLPNGAGTATITIDVQPAPAFAPGDTVWIDATPLGPQVGDAEWAIRGGSAGPAGLIPNYWSYYSPSNLAPYRELNDDGGQIMTLVALGLAHADFMPAVDYFVRAEATDEPTSGQNWTSKIDNINLGSGNRTMAQDVYSQHWAAISAVSQVV